MKNTVKITFSNNDTITTGINGTKSEVINYYRIGQKWNIGIGEHDLIAEITKLDFLTESK